MRRMAPIALFNDDRDELEMGNPNLKPYEADNYDLSIEYYPTKLAVLSAGVFYKSIDNAIFPATYEIDQLPAEVELSFLPASYVANLEEVSTYINVDRSYVRGVEFNYVQGLGFINESLDGFLLSGDGPLSLSAWHTGAPLAMPSGSCRQS